MGALLGLTFGVGVVLLWRGSRAPVAAGPAKTGRSVGSRLDELIAEAGVEAVSPRQLLASSAGAGAGVALVVLAVSRTWPIAVAFGLFAGYAPIALVRHRARVRRRERRDLWPDVVDNLASAIRAGLSLPEALSQLGVRGPEPMRRPFELFAEDYRAGGRFHECLDRLKERLADPTGDRIVESLRIARDVGGTDLGRLLRTLSTFLRDDARARSELETRQGWVVNAARLAVAAPWILLGLLSLRSSSVQAYNAPSGWIVLAGGAGACVLAYWLMLRLGRLPDDERVLR
ncbi:MAG TPA: type II secretion system F family protein [Actinomycetes bacterium]|jgi:tight adherence protein B|nr:type II secretion system F family protein [Actinomycetes bacterium]